MSTGDRDDTIIPIIPDGCVDIVFVFSGGGAESFIIGATEKITGCRLTRNKQIFGVKFSPGNARNYLPVSAKMLTSKQRPLCMLYNDCGPLHENMLKAERFVERAELVKNYLNAHYLGHNAKYNIVDFCTRKIIGGCGNIKIEALCEEVGYSKEYILSLFYEFVGLSPKKFNDIVRLYSTLHYLFDKDPDSFGDVATMFGYVDQSHMNKHFRQYLNKSISDVKKYMHDFDLYDKAEYSYTL